VRDDGIGIPREALDSIFQVFSQVQGAVGRSQGGLGIGLSLVKGLVELHGGTVVAHSEGPGHGSEFVVTLPCLPEPESTGAEARSDDASSSAARPTGRRILVVDDNRDAADSLVVLLQFDGHDVRVAYTGQEALQVAGEFEPEVVVLDLGLPDLSGFDVAQSLRQDTRTAGAQIIALTGWGHDEHRRRARESGIDHHLTKPVDPEQLARLIADAAGPGHSR
jgi:CheY-like chemotaxis protein